MHIQFNTARNIEGTEGLAAYVKDVLESMLARFADQITRIEVHLSDENGVKNGQDDKRCVVEARLKGQQPIAVTHHAPTLNLAIDGAAHKVVRLVEGVLERRHEVR